MPAFTTAIAAIVTVFLAFVTIAVLYFAVMGLGREPHAR